MGQLPETADVVIIGGGVIGLSVSRALALRGIAKVALIERAGLGAEASSAAAGMLAPQAEADCADDFFKLTCQSRDMYTHFAATLLEETGIDIELETTGTLYLALTEYDETEIEHRYNWQTRAGLPVEKLRTEEARRLEPRISEHVRAALKFPFDVQVENRRLINALAAANEKLGVHLATGTTVESLRLQRNRIEGVETSRGFVSTPQVVIAGGAWTPFIKGLEKALPNLRIEPVRGQMICCAATPAIGQHVIYSPRGYIVPRRDGRLLAGSTTERAGFDKRVTVSAVHTILANACEISPEISRLPVVDMWAGLRPRAQDSLPAIGPCDAINGLFCATGHYRNGILLAPITGDLIAGAIVDNVIPALLRAFAPDRFDLVTVNQLGCS